MARDANTDNVRNAASACKCFIGVDLRQGNIVSVYCRMSWLTSIANVGWYDVNTVRRPSRTGYMG